MNVSVWRFVFLPILVFSPHIAFDPGTSHTFLRLVRSVI